MRSLRNRFRSTRVADDRDDRAGDGRVVEDGDGDRRVVRDGGGRRGTQNARRALARLIDLITLLVVVTIILGIALVLLKANPENEIVDTIRNVAKYMSRPFDAIFEMDKRRTEIAVNWGIAAVVYLVIGRVLAAVLKR